MVHILGVYIPDDKRVVIGLTHIYGIGRFKASFLCQELGINESTRVRDLTDSQRSNIFQYIEENFCVESDLRREKSTAIKQLIEISGHRGFRHRIGLPLRGQRTHTNAKTQKKLANKNRQGG
jgi:small subunit ribosomal protein S13